LVLVAVEIPWARPVVQTRLVTVVVLISKRSLNLSIQDITSEEDAFVSPQQGVTSWLGPPELVGNLALSIPRVRE
jgi:hypothetical protein